MHPVHLTYEALCLDLVYQKRILPQLLSMNLNNSFTMVIENNQISNQKKCVKRNKSTNKPFHKIQYAMPKENV